MKNNTIIALFLLGLVLVLFNVGCATSNSTATATTTSTAAGATTSTTVPIANTISGTITLPGNAGCLWVGATTDSTFGSGVYPGEITYEVTSGVTTYNYSLPMSAAGTGTYYVVAVLAVGQSSYPGPTRYTYGDRLHQRRHYHRQGF
jgi:hypothetical protein